MQQTEKMLSPREIAQLKRWTLNYTYQVLWAGRLPGAIQVEGKWRIPVNALDASTKTA